MKRARIIYNPASGKAQFRKFIPDILQKLESNGYETSCHATSSYQDAIEAAKLSCQRKYDIVIVSGGDGTLNAVVTGLSQVKNPPKLGLIPAGTTNDFARAMGISGNILAAVDIILENHPIPIDVGTCLESKFFINIAAGGIFTEVSYTTSNKLKSTVGELAYMLEGIKQVPTVQPIYAEIEYDEKIFKGEIMMFLISNTTSVGGFGKIAPIASANDGKFDLIIIKKGNVPELIDVATKILSGKHINHPLVHYAHATHIKINTPKGMNINIDGEYGGTTPTEFKNLQHHLQVFLPKGERK